MIGPLMEPGPCTERARSLRRGRLNARHAKMGADLQPAQAILLVDDDQALLQTLRVTLAAEGFNHVRTADDRGVDAALRDPCDYAAVLLDIMMQEHNGLDLLRQLTERRPEVPVIMLTGVDDGPSALEAMRAGAFDYVVKPV